MKIPKHLKSLILYLLAAAAGAFGYSATMGDESVTISIPAEEAAPAEKAESKSKAKSKSKSKSKKAE